MNLPFMVCLLILKRFDIEVIWDSFLGEDEQDLCTFVDEQNNQFYFSFNADPISVILVDNSSQEEICVNMDLIKQGHAVLNVGDHNQGSMSSRYFYKYNNMCFHRLPHVYGWKYWENLLNLNNVSTSCLPVDN